LGFEEESSRVRAASESEEDAVSKRQTSSKADRRRIILWRLRWKSCVFEMTFMRRGERDFMMRVELDNITVYLDDIHLTPLSESGLGGPSRFSKRLFLLGVKGFGDPFQTRILQG
jgi:hypothetical protein